MTVGLITRDKDGSVTTDMTKRLSQAEGVVRTNRVGGSQLISLPPGRNYFYIIAVLEDSQRTGGKRPGVTLTQNLITWNYSVPSGFSINCEIYYGYY